ncbi:hypothetical protein DXG03_002679 [Asterophora parasitica]|uniref:Rab-GAP TBC domain-containing protein n=1 Tax=Asterophora parasitica TaxID=117018 RepID=A0A9P7GA26_9AGAR|nr:hypothetical protein DXG03_002679 [Asterophora parasitica]
MLNRKVCTLLDLDIVSDLLIQRLGPDFAHSAAGNHDNHVAPVALQTITAPPSTAETLDSCLQKIANDYGVKWSPEPRREEILNTLSEILDPHSSPVVDMAKLRHICCRGIPDEPSWIRPRIWKLFLGILPVLKASWGGEMQKHRDNYYDLIQRLVEPFSALPPPTQPPTPLDSVLLDVSKQLSSIPFTLFGELIDTPESFESCPLDYDARDEIKITCARNLDIRLHDLKQPTDEMPLQPIENGTPEISLSTPEGSTFEGLDGPTRLLSFKPRVGGNPHPKHASALLRLLYLHASINPGNLSPHIPSLLVPLYTVLHQEAIPDDLAHAEADTFWLFEAMVGEFSELEDEEGGSIWTKRLSERLSWADSDLFNNLPMACTSSDSHVALGLDISDHLLNISAAMLIRSRAALFRLGKSGRKSPSLWTEETNALPPPSPLRAWELGDAFLEGMSLLQLYPLEAAGGIDRILQTASDLAYRRDEEIKLTQRHTLSLGTRLKTTVWKGFTNQEPSPDISPEESEDNLSDDDSPDDGNDTETPESTEPGITSRLANTMWRGITNQTSMEPPPSPLQLSSSSTPSSPSFSTQEAVTLKAGPGLTARLATTVWRGITNQTSMEPPPSPLSPQSPSFHPSSSPPTQSTMQASDPFRDESSTSKSGLWGYADKLKDSDAVATLAKASTNWRAKAMLGSWGRSSAPPPLPKVPGRSGSISEGSNIRPDEGRRGSLPSIDRSDVYSPPPRPLYFRPPRDSIILPANQTLPSEQSSHDSSLTDKARSLQSSLAALTRNSPSQSVPKSGPRPLLLSPSTPMTSPPNRPTLRSAGSTPAPARGEWADVMTLKGRSLHRDSQSSVSSLSPSDAFRSARSNRTEWDSDTGTSSRRVALNRKSVSPMAPIFRTRQERPDSASSSATSSEHGLLSPGTSTHGDLQDWNNVDAPESPLTSPPVLKSPTVFQPHENGVAPVSADDADDLPEPKKLVRKRTPTSPQYQPDDTSDSSLVRIPSRSPRLRSKGYTARLPNLNIPENGSCPQLVVERKSSNPNTLAVEWPVDDQEVARTPRASSFHVDDVPMSTTPNSSRSLRRSRKASTETQERLRKSSTDGSDTRLRKISSGQRTRKVSSEHRDVVKRATESSAEEGDDEGYDDLLSAYESDGQVS